MTLVYIIPGNPEKVSISQFFYNLCHNNFLTLDSFLCHNYILNGWLTDQNYHIPKPTLEAM